MSLSHGPGALHQRSKRMISPGAIVVKRQESGSPRETIISSTAVVERSSTSSPAPSSSVAPPPSSSSVYTPPPPSSTPQSSATSSTNNYVPPSSSYTPPPSSTYSYVPPSSTYSYVPPTTASSVVPASTTSLSSSQISTSTSFESVIPTPTTDAALLQPTEIAAEPTASPTATSGPQGFAALVSSPLKIVGTVAVSTLILVILIFLISFITRKCLLKRRRRNEVGLIAGGGSEEDEGMDEKYGRHSITSAPPGWTPYGFELTRPQSYRSDSNSSFNQYPTPAGLRPFHLPSPTSTTTLPDRPSTRTLLPTRLAAPKPVYPSTLRPFALPSPPLAPLLPLSMQLQQQQQQGEGTPLSTRENLDAWKVWASGAVESAGAALGGFVKTRTVADSQEVELRNIEEKRESVPVGGDKFISAGGNEKGERSHSVGSIGEAERRKRNSESIFLPTPLVSPHVSPSKKRSSALLPTNRSPLKPTLERTYTNESEESIDSHLLPYRQSSPTKSSSQRASYQSHYSQTSITSSTPSRSGSMSTKRKISTQIRRGLSRKESAKVLTGREKLARARALVIEEREGGSYR